MTGEIQRYRKFPVASRLSRQSLFYKQPQQTQRSYSVDINFEEDPLPTCWSQFRYLKTRNVVKGANNRDQASRVAGLAASASRFLARRSPLAAPARPSTASP